MTTGQSVAAWRGLLDAVNDVVIPTTELVELPQPASQSPGEDRP